MTTDRALELAEALLHKERMNPRILFDQAEVVEVLRVLDKLRDSTRA